MKSKEDAIAATDALIDLHRDIMRIKAASDDRGSRGRIGKSTPGDRLKRDRTGSLKSFARRHAADAESVFHADAIAWLKGKRCRLPEVQS